VGKRGFGAEGKVVEAQGHAREAQQKATESAERATQAEKQARELSGPVAEAERRAAASEQRALVAEQRVADVERTAAEDAADAGRRHSADRGIAAKLKRTEDERDQLVARLDQLEHATTKASATPPNGKSSKRGSRSSRAPVAQTTSNSNQRRSRSRTPG
jgi:membrane protein involved in colicin uptake